MQALFDRQREAFRADPVPTADSRIADLRRLKQALLDHRETLADAVSRDFGCRAREETLLAELMPSVMGINLAVRRVRRWMRPRPRHVDLLLQPLAAWVQWQPVGVVGIIVPWNYPIFLALGPLTGALAAGNRALLKLSEFTPSVNEALRRTLAEAFAEDKVAVVTGDAAIGARFASLRFDHLLFTGNGEVGRRVMHAAADHLTPVTLELGGKSPLIVDDRVPLARVIDRVVFGKSLNAGQTCVAPDYVLCPEARVEEFVAAYRTAFVAMYPKLADNPQYTSIASDRQYARLQALLADARERGARVIEVNPAGEPLEAQRKMAPHLVLGADDGMRVMQQEIFGPILPVIGYRSLDDALRRIDSGPRPLALYLFSDDDELRRKVIADTRSGGVGLNEVVLHAGVDDLPFGGIGASGMGQYHGWEGFRTFSKPRGVIRKGRINTTALIYPPYGGWLQRMVFRLGLR